MKNVKIIFAVLFLSTFIMTSCSSSSEGVEMKTNKEVKAILEGDNVMMIDVREPDELEKLAYDVNGVVNIPLSTFEDDLSKIPKDKTIIVACRSGHRSMQAANILAENNYPNIINLKGGIMAWEKDGFGVVEKKSCCSDPSSENCNADGTCKK